MEDIRDMSCMPAGLQISPLPDSLVDGTRPLKVIRRLEGECFRALEQKGERKRERERKREAQRN